MSSIANLIGDEGLSCHASQNLLNQLAGELLHYTDEGTMFSPKILFCTNATTALETFPGSVRHVVGNSEFGPSTVKKILKDCAPLAMGSWNIFVERLDSERVRYGVFSYINLPTTLPIEEAITIVTNTTCLLMQKTSSNTIELRGAKGNGLTLAFSTTREAEIDVPNPIQGFANDCCVDLLAGSTTSEFKLYFSRLLDEALASSHGTMLACASEPRLNQMNDMKDGIEIEPTLDFYAAYEAYRSDRSAESIIRLQNTERLLHGILQCDGILIFNTKGALVAYRVFYRPSSSTPTTLAAPAAGGARRRAFESAKTMVGSVLKSLLFRSQDGLTIKEGGA